MSHGLGGDPAPGLACGNLTDTFDFAGLTVKNTFIDIKAPGSPTDAGGPPTVTAPPGMAGMHRLFGKIKKKSPALETESSLGPQPPAILEGEPGPTAVANLESEDFPGTPMRVLPNMGGLLPSLDVGGNLQDSLAGLTVKNTFIGIKTLPTSDDGPPTVTAPPGMAGMHRLFGKIQLAPRPRGDEEASSATEAAPSLGTQPPAMLEGMGSPTTTANLEPAGLPMRVLPSMASECATSSSSPPPGLSEKSDLNWGSGGSTLHDSGACSPCAWFWKPTSCSKGADCARCHICPDGELKRRKKNRVATSGSSGPAESSLGQTKLASVPQEPAYVVCATSDHEDDFPQSTKVTVGDVPVKNTFINFDLRPPDYDADASSPPTVSAPGALLTRLFKTRPRPLGSSPYAGNPMEAGPSAFPPFIPPFIPAAPTPWRPPGILTDTVPFAPHSRPPGVLGPRVEPGWTDKFMAGFMAAPPLQAAAAAGDHYNSPQDAEGEVGNMNNEMYQLHLTRDCTPCNYFYYKVDGCRQGSDCQFCHLCPKGEIKKRKKERVKMLKSGGDNLQ